MSAEALSSEWTSRLKTPIPILALALLGLLGCHPMPPGKPLNQLNPQELSGHDVFQAHCARCHYPDSERGLHGPGLLGLFRQPYLPSGISANDERVTSIILHGRGMMPAMSGKLDDRQLQDLLAYLHTL